MAAGPSERLLPSRSPPLLLRRGPPCSSVTNGESIAVIVMLASEPRCTLACPDKYKNGGWEVRKSVRKWSSQQPTQPARACYPWWDGNSHPTPPHRPLHPPLCPPVRSQRQRDSPCHPKEHLRRRRRRRRLTSLEHSTRSISPALARLVPGSGALGLGRAWENVDGEVETGPGRVRADG